MSLQMKRMSINLILNYLMYSYSTISSQYNISINHLYEQAQRFNIVQGIGGFSESQVQLLINYYRYPTPKNSKKKIEILEFYLGYQNIKETANVFDVSQHYVRAIKREYLKTGCLVIESKMNSL